MGKTKTWAIFLLCLLPLPVLAMDYEIRLEPRAKVGDSFLLEAKGWQSERCTVRMDGELLRDDRENFLMEFEGVVTILKTNDKGGIVSEAARVIKCEKTEAYERVPLLHEGSLIVATQNGGSTEFIVDGTLASKELAAVLDLILSVKKGGLTDDEIFGTKVRKRIGDEWAVNTEAVAIELGKERKVAKKEGISGGSRLEGVESVDGVEWLQIGSELKVIGMVPELPDGIAVERSTLQANFLSKVPAQGDGLPMEEATAMEFSFLARGKPEPAAPEMVVESALNLRVKQTTSPVIKD